MSMHAFRSIVTASRNAVNTIEITSQGLWGYVPGIVAVRLVFLRSHRLLKRFQPEWFTTSCDSDGRVSARHTSSSLC